MKIVKFFGTSVIATSVDFLLYIALIELFTPTVSNAMSAGAGMIVNFTLQYRFVFTPTNTLKKSILFSMAFACLGVGLGTGLIHVLTRWTPLVRLPVAAKVITTCVIFFYNYFTRKFSFGDKPEPLEESC